MLPIDLQILKYIFFEKPIYHLKQKPFLDTKGYKQLEQKLESYQPNPNLLGMTLENAPFTVFDLETTGLLPEIGHEVISIGAIQIKGQKHCKVERFHQIIKPIRPVPKNTLSLTGINKTQLMNAKPFIDGFSRFLKFSKDSVLVAHPAQFDMRFLQTMLKRWKLPAYSPFVIDSQALAKLLVPNQQHQLDQLLKHFKIKNIGRHHALNDAIMTAELFENLLVILADKHQINTVEELMLYLSHSINSKKTAKSGIS